MIYTYKVDGLGFLPGRLNIPAPWYSTKTDRRIAGVNGSDELDRCGSTIFNLSLGSFAVGSATFHSGGPFWGQRWHPWELGKFEESDDDDDDDFLLFQYDHAKGQRKQGCFFERPRLEGFLFKSGQAVLMSGNSQANLLEEAGHSSINVH